MAADDAVILYLFHWDQPLDGGRSPQHYLGSAPEDRLAERMAEHFAGHGAKILRAAIDYGREPVVVRLWRGTRAEESRLKRAKRGFRGICPACGGNSS